MCLTPMMSSHMMLPFLHNINVQICCPINRQLMSAGKSLHDKLMPHVPD